MMLSPTIQEQNGVVLFEFGGGVTITAEPSDRGGYEVRVLDHEDEGRETVIGSGTVDLSDLRERKAFQESIVQRDGKVLDWDARLLLVAEYLSQANKSESTNDSAPGREPKATSASPRSGVSERLSAAKAELPPFSIATSPSSFVTEYIKYGAARTDAPPEAHELFAVGTLSALAGPTPRLPIATSSDGWPLVLWTMYIVDSTVGRKSTTVDQSADIIREVLGDRAVISWEGSPQGLIQRMQERDGQGAAFIRDEFSGLMQQMNNGGHMAGLSQMLIRAFDGRLIENIRTRKKGAGGEFQRDEDRVEHPYLAMLAASTRTSFLESASSANVIDGFLARFVFATGSAEERPLGLLTPDLSAQRAALLDHARRFYEKARQCALIDIGEGVLEMQWELEREWREAAKEATHPAAAGPSMKRLAESVLKTAALLALDECNEGLPVVTSGHFRMAEVMGRRWQVSTIAVIEDLGASSFLRDCDAIMTSVEGRVKGIPLSDLYRLHRSLRKRDFDQVLDALEMQNRMERRQLSTGRPGRTPVVIYPFGSAPEELSG